MSIDRFKTGLKVTALVCVVVGLIVMSGQPANAEIQKKHFQVVGTWGMLEHWMERESKLWGEMIPSASGGKLTANAKAMTELGLSGFELMRQLKFGAFDFAHGVVEYASGEDPALEGTFLAGVTQDIKTHHKILAAYRPVIERKFQKLFNAKILMFYTWPSQQIYCNLKDKNIKNVSLKNLVGKKIRTYNTTLGDFVEGLNAIPVTMTAAEATPALQKGVVDCGITGTLPAYKIKFYQVVTHNFHIRLGHVAAYLAVNNKVWAGLNADTRKVIEGEVAKIEKEMWEATAVNDQLGMDCNTSGPCGIGEPGGIILVELSDADKEKVDTIVNDYVLKRWAKRCGQKCADEWNDTVGKVVGRKASMD